MDLIDAFIELRQDGKEIVPGMTFQTLSQLGWAPSKIVRVSWLAGQRQLALDYPDGVLAKVLPGRGHVAVIPQIGGAAGSPKLTVMDAQGRECYVLGSAQEIAGVMRYGSFLWFEPSDTDPEHRFGVVFETADQQFLLELEINSGAVKVVRELR
ncbi:hypothetical protein [Pseudoduganella sp. R-34]|uniref:hypothetical protein n=1 Tax=unclassified Pseudoduganella TaxID=2637179 RepID=UPI003CF4602C